MNKNKHLVLNKNEFLLLEDFSDYNRFPKLQPIDDRLQVNEQFSIIIDHRNNTKMSTCNLYIMRSTKWNTSELKRPQVRLSLWQIILCLVIRASSADPRRAVVSY